MVTDIFRKRDFAFLVIIAITTYLCLDSNNFSYVFEPAWYLDQRSTNAKSGKIIPPIITDLDGDGEKEIIIITNNFELKIVSAQQTPESYGKDIYTPTEIASYKLLQSDNNNDHVSYFYLL